MLVAPAPVVVLWSGQAVGSSLAQYDPYPTYSLGTAMDYGGNAVGNLRAEHAGAVGAAVGARGAGAVGTLKQTRQSQAVGNSRGSTVVDL